MSVFPATRADALNRLAEFVPLAGRAYAEQRNFDEGPGGHRHVSRLSAALRRRLISEDEVIAAVLDQHSASDAEKFISEICWRTYWKGWLEQRPSVCDTHGDELADDLHALTRDRSLRQRYDAAIDGRTGIAAFDAWAHELVSTGYLHNWARMQFASIWLFTLKLPIALGIAHTERHFIDADPASNTLSWRWVAGAHTVGKTYLADGERIRAMTRGRLSAWPLARTAHPVETAPSPSVERLRVPAKVDPLLPSLLLIGDDDLSLDAADPASLSVNLSACDIRGVAALAVRGERGPAAEILSQRALADGLSRAEARFAVSGSLIECAEPVTAIIALARKSSATQIIMPYAQAGPSRKQATILATGLSQAGLTVGEVQRRWDRLAWPHCTKGFFALKQQIPMLIDMGNG
jgi:FAD binding domain of DNA photolyase